MAKLKANQEKAPNQGGVERVVMRNLFYKDQLSLAQLLFILLLILNVALIGALYFNISHPRKPVYFPATSDWQIIERSALTDPIFDNDHVIQWSSRAVSQIFALDFLHWRDQLSTSSSLFTKRGWTYFIDSFKKNNNLSTLQQYKMVSSASITGAPTIVRKGVVNDHYGWTVQVPVMISYSGSGKDINQPAMVIIKIDRANVVQYPERLAIDMLVVNQQAVTNVGT